MAKRDSTRRRSYGTGSLTVRTDRAGVERWVGQWYSHGSKVKRTIGVKRTTGSRDGLTRAQAEAELRRLMTAVTAKPQRRNGITLADLSERYQRHVKAQGRKRSTLAAIESVNRIWLEPHLGDRVLDRIRVEDVEDLMIVMHNAGVGPKSIRNYVGVLSSMYRFAMHDRRRWATRNPCDGVDLPPKPQRTRTSIRFLTVDEVHALVTAALAGPYHEIDRALYLTASMTGLRQGELLGLRWCDVDWRASRIRVEQTHVLGDFDTPKSERGARSVPMADEVGGALDRLSKSSGSIDEHDLVFADPFTGQPLRRGALMRRYRRALKAALLPADHRFHDLRHTFATTMAAQGVSIHALQEWLGHEDPATTEIYKHYAPNAHEVDQVNAAFRRGSIRGGNLSEPDMTSEHRADAVEPDSPHVTAG